MANESCPHGLVQQQKFGVEQRDGMEICRGCGLPTAESYLARVAADGPGARTLQDRARAARASGDRFFEVQLEVAESSRDVRFGEADSGNRSEQQHGETLGLIEAEGWRLETVGYVFVPTGQSTRQKVLGTGESVAVSGVVVGIYLFRAADGQSSQSSGPPG